MMNLKIFYTSMRDEHICRFMFRNFLILSLLIGYALPVSAQTASPVELRVIPQEVQVAVGQTVDLAIEVANVAELYAFDLLVAFDSQAVEVVDMIPTMEGIQVSLGTFLEPGFVILNLVDNDLGRLRMVMTQLNPATPKDGTGTLLIIRLRGKQTNLESPIEIVLAKLASPNGQEIPFESVKNGLVSVVQIATGPTNTPIPSQEPGTPMPKPELPTLDPQNTEQAFQVQQPTQDFLMVQPSPTGVTASPTQPLPTQVLTPTAVTVMETQVAAASTPAQEVVPSQSVIETIPPTEVQQPESVSSSEPIGSEQAAKSSSFSAGWVILIGVLVLGGGAYLLLRGNFLKKER